MPPKIKTTKEEIITAAVEIVRELGAGEINARTIAARLNCSTQPVFSNFASMEELRFAVVERADELCREYMQREIASGKYPEYKASGMAYIRFAMEEKELVIQGRHDPCIVPRAVPVVEAAAAIALYDAFLSNK